MKKQKGKFIDHMIRDKKPPKKHEKPRGYTGDLKEDEELATYKGGRSRPGYA